VGEQAGWPRAHHRSDHRADKEGQRRRQAEALDHDRAEHAAAGECWHQAEVPGRERLWAAAEITGYQDGRWASFKQCQQIGAQVRWGEKGTPVVFTKTLPRRGGNAATGGPISGQFKESAAEATGAGTYLLAKSSTIFNTAEVESVTNQFKPSSLPL
jgi:hypothetical protein